MDSKFIVKIFDEDGDSYEQGQFDTKEEALKCREELIKKSFDYVGVFERKPNAPEVRS